MNPLAAAPIARTLIADDQPDVLAALRLLLKGAGYQTEAATSPAGVLEAIKRQKFDVVLMDLNYARDTTSGDEGLDLISSIRALDNVLPIVVMTAWGSVDLAVESMRRGVRDFVQKPWDNSRLLQTLRTQIEEGRAKRQRRRRNLETRLHSRQMQSQLAEARVIQEGLLPKSMPTLNGVELASAWRPATEVSGDYLSSFSVSSDCVALCVADVAGKGLPAALLMANMQSILRSIASDLVEPSSVCSRLNEMMCANIPENKFITCFYAVLNTENKKLTFTNAGHNYPALVRADGTRLRLKEGGHVLGAFEESTYVQGEVQLRTGDRLLMFTDGLTETTNAAGEEFGESRLLDSLMCERWRDARDLQQELLRQVTEFNGGEFEDDATSILVAVQ
ncbi:MAG: response regulator receiver protein [Acidobacteria bacterium]|nr:MAG: response regulator receiver protein [Acidobacteriota bacterium]